MKSIIRIFLLAIVTVIGLIIFVKLNYDKVIEMPNSDDTEKITFQIGSGESVDSIVDKLVEKGLLKEKWAIYFKAYLKLQKISQTIQAGEYQIPKNLSIKEIAQTIQQARGLDIWITIPEGLRKDEIAEILDTQLKAGGNPSFDKDTFLELTTDSDFILTLGFPYTLSDLEGFLFPDKYAFANDSQTADVLKVMINNFQTKVGVKDTYDDIIIASIVEREGYDAQDRPMIADILKRRLAEGWLLEVDASLLYPVKDWKHVITKEDKESNNEYNTYKKAGLPPTPICNPGLEAINSTRNPQPNNYYFYIHDPEGNVHFAETYAEHNRNVEKYLR
jgi:UPF0755 protein